MLTFTKRRASEMLEAVITLPVALFVTVIVINLGFVMYAQQAVQNAANYGARIGSVAQDCRSCAAYSAASGQLQQTAVRNGSVSILAPGGVVGSTLRIQVTGEVPNLMGPFMSFFGGGFGGPIQVKGEASFRAEGW